MLNIKQRQQNLQTYYLFYNGKIDGIEGVNTKKAYRSFQKFVGITVDGIYGRNTNEKLVGVIKDLQGKLNSHGYNLVVDGIAGNNTINAIKDFQKKNGLAVDGIAGTNTFKKLDNENRSSTKYRFPVNYIYVSQTYKSTHKAVDLGWSSKYYGRNQDIYACYDGTVIVNSYASDAGNYVAIRHDNGDISRYLHLKSRSNLKIGTRVQKGEKVALVATGLMVQEALEAAKKMETAPTVVNIHTIKPIDKELIIELAKTHDTIVTCEEHSIIGGLGSAVAEVLAEAGTACKLVRVGVQDVFGESGKPAELFAKYKIDADAIVEAATK